MEYIITVFHAPLEAKGFSAEATGRNNQLCLQISSNCHRELQEDLVHIAYLSRCPNILLLCLAYPFLPAELSRFSLS